MFDVLETLEDAIDKVAASEQRLDVERVGRLVARVEFLQLRAIREYEVSGAWHAEGFLGVAAALRAKCRMAPGAARRAVVLARKLESLPETAASFGEGVISREHAAVIAGAHRPERAGAIEQVEGELAAVARLTHPGRLRDAVKRVTDAVDGDGGAASDAEEQARNHLTFDATFNGRFEPHGSVDAESGEIIAAALDAEMETLRRPEEQCTRPQRRAEALTSICRWYLAHHDRGTPRRRGQHHLTVVVDLAELTGADTALLADVRAEAAHGSRLSRATIERLSCDARISRVITDGPSAVLDAGRSTRVVSTAMWNALVVRDGHCQAPGCRRPPGFCEAHHIRHWARGGPTDLANLRLLCWQHHRAVHAHGPPRRE